MNNYNALVSVARDSASPTPTPTSIAAAVSAAVNADSSCPVTSSPSAGVITFTAKSKGFWGNYITLALNLGASDASISGITSVFVAMTSGAGTNSVSVTAALAALGSNDGANAAGFTDIVHGPGEVPHSAPGWQIPNESPILYNPNDPYFMNF